MIMDDLLTASQLAGRLQVKPQTVYLWYRQGLIPGHRLSHKVLRFSLSEVVAALADRRRTMPRRRPEARQPQVHHGAAT